MHKKHFWKKVRHINKKTTKNSLEYSIKEGSAFSVMSGFGKNYLSTFAVALNATNMHLAFLNSFPTLIGSIIQIFGARITDYTGKRMELILKTVMLQALMWLPLFFLPLLFRDYSMHFLIFFATLNYVLEVFGAPAWNSLMGDIVKENERGIYFGRRNKINGVVAFGSVVCAGLVLSIFEGVNKWIGFFILFTIAFVARIVSYYYMKKIHEPKYKVELSRKYNFGQFLRSLNDTNFGRFITYNTLFKFVVNMASPFFIPFLLLNAGYSYLELTLALSASAIASFLVMMYWGRNADIFGNRKIMMICGFLIPLIPLLWVFSHNLIFILIVQCLSGFVWSGYNLTSSNFVYDTVEPGKRTKGFAFYNLFWGIAVFLGSIIGGIFASILPQSGLGVTSLISSNYEIVFLCSAILRLVIMVVYMPKFKEVRKVKPAEAHVLFFKLVAVRPLSGIIVNTVGSLDFTYKQLKKHYKKPYEYLIKQTGLTDNTNSEKK